MVNEKAKSIDEYIARYPADIQERLEQMRHIIKKAAPDAEEIISYSMPAFRQKKIVVYFGAAKNHIGLYPTASGVEAFKEELSDYNWSKGAIQFPFGKPMPSDLISRIVKYRVAENLRKGK